MRKVIAAEFVSLDGFMSDPKDEMDWVMDVFNEEMGIEIKEQQASVDTMLLGRVTYDILASYWPSASPDTEDAEMIEHLNSTPKVVFSRTLDSVDWNNSRLVKDNIGEEIQRLKRLPGKDMAIIGSASIVQQLMNDDLIDEFRLLVHPVVLGRGKPLFSEIRGRHKLNIIKAETFKNGVLSLRYQPAE